MELESERGCLQCGTPFTAKRNDARYCSDACRKAYDRIEAGQKMVDPAIIPDNMDTVMKKGCLQCGKVYFTNHTSSLFCCNICYMAFHALPETERYLNAPIIPDKPLQHGDMYTTEGDEIKLEKGILRVRRRFVDKKKAELVASSDSDKPKSNGHSQQKRRGQ